MNDMYKDIDIVIFDVMGVIITSQSLVKEGLYPHYKGKYDNEYLKVLYRKIRKDTSGDASLWNEIGEKNPEVAREGFLGRFLIDTQFWEYRNFLSKKNIRKGILSNMPREWGEYFFKKFNLKNEFDPIVISGEVGMSKPERGIYLEFEKRSGIPLERSLFIDDKLINLKTAYDLGVKTVYFNRKKKKRNIEGFQPDYEVSSFADLF
jgi:putative hydrolase of the HAD superfamily